MDARRFIDTAADALLIGISDPLEFLGRGDGDWLIQAAIVQRAYQRHNERRGEELSQLAKAIGSQVGAQIARMFR